MFLVFSWTNRKELKDKIKISVVEYLNATPFVYGLLNSGCLNTDDVQIDLDIPSVCAKKLVDRTVDIGLVPVAIIPKLKEHYILTDYCIGADGKVNSVLLLSNVPMENIKTILLDFHSRTSVALTRILAAKLWNISPEWKNAEEGFIASIHNETAGVVIGDRALAIKDNYRYCYDLSEEWRTLTDLPFVFACWVANKKLSEDFTLAFSKAIEFGMKNKQKVIDEIVKSGKYTFDVDEYLNHYIQFNLDEDKKKGLSLFLDYLKDLTPILQK